MTPAAPGRPAVGLFGKHPAWPDHLTLPLGSAGLRDLWQTLYAGGIRSAIEQAAWADAAVPFGHWVCLGADAGSGTEWTLGRVWPSADAIGRRDYPLVAAVSWPGVGLPALVGLAGPVLTDLERACGTAADAAGVTAAVAAVDRGFDALAPADPPPAGVWATVAGVVAGFVAGWWNRPPPPAPDAVVAAALETPAARALAADPAVAGHVLRACAAAWAAGPPVALRLALGRTLVPDALAHWAAFAAAAAGPRGRVFAAVADGREWIDLFVGTVPAADFARLRLDLDGRPVDDPRPPAEPGEAVAG